MSGKLQTPTDRRTSQVKDKPKTIEVMFRKYRDKSAEILAVFPYVPHNRAQTLVAC